jgi:hypothetical protein
MKIIYCIFLGLILLSCSNKTANNDNNKAVVDNFQLSDSLFPYQNIKSTLITRRFCYDREKDIRYTDSSKRKTFVFLDSSQKVRFIAPAIIDENKGNENINNEYVAHFMEAFFISKQKKIYEFTPIVVAVNGDDYGALFLILLDQLNSPVSFYRISGGINAGPVEETDSTLILGPDRESFLKDTEIFSYELSEIKKLDTIKRMSIIDSITFKSKILPSGKIETIKLDSVRYERKSKW